MRNKEVTLALMTFEGLLPQIVAELPPELRIDEDIGLAAASKRVLIPEAFLPAHIASDFSHGAKTEGHMVR